MRSMHRQVILLAAAQALFQSASVMVITVGGLAGASIAANPAFATAPVASMFFGTATATIPASIWMARVGRKTGFLVGSLAGILGGLLAATGLWAGSLAVLSAGTFLVGVYQAFSQFYRFAAAEIADPGFRPRAISFVLAGGVFAAIVGPLLGRYGQEMLQPLFAGSFLLLSAVSFVASLILLGLSIPRPQAMAAGAAAAARPLREIVLQPSYLVALFGAATGYGVMILAMTATPIAMHHHHHGISSTAFVIQMHVLGMFLPSFFTGSLISRFGVVQIMLAGVVLLTGHVLLTLTGTELYSFLSALILLGVGWNFLYIGGTTLLTASYTPQESGRAQGINDLTIFVVGLASSLAAGALFRSLGWVSLNLMLLPWLGIAAAALLWYATAMRRANLAVK